MLSEAHMNPKRSTALMEFSEEIWRTTSKTRRVDKPIQTTGPQTTLIKEMDKITDFFKSTYL